MTILVLDRQIKMAYERATVEERLKQGSSIFLLDNYFLQRLQDDCMAKLQYNATHISEDTLMHVLKHLQSDNQEAWVWLRQLKSRINASKRVYSTSHRLEVAYKQRYRCARCREMLKPTFQVDHIVELAEGGKDEMQNLQAICVECHQEKTRLFMLKRGKMFSSYYADKYDAFMSYHRKRKRSKYF